MAQRVPDPTAGAAVLHPGVTDAAGGVRRTVPAMPLLAGRRPDPLPLQTDDARTVAVGAAAWAVAFVVLGVLRLTETTRVETWWLVMCLYGSALGAVGVRYCRRRQAAIARDEAAGIPRRG